MNKISLVIPFLVITLLCLGGVKLFYKLLERVYLRPIVVPREAIKAEPTSPGKTNKIVENHDYQVIIDRNLFRASLDVSETENSKRDPLEGLAPTSLDVVLMGTVFSEGDEKRAFILETGQKNQEMYYIGNSIKGAIIKDIFRGKVILSYKYQDEVLNMNETKNHTPESLTTAQTASLHQQKAPSVSREVKPSRSAGDFDHSRTQDIPPMRKFNLKTGTKNTDE